MFFHQSTISQKYHRFENQSFSDVSMILAFTLALCSQDEFANKITTILKYF